MKIQLASDLHLEFHERAFPGFRAVRRAPGADVLVLAGDIHSGTKGVAAFANFGCPVLYVPGNHEFYGQDYERLRESLKRAAQHTPVAVLDNDEVVLNGVRFLGTTMWTDYRFYGSLPLTRALALAEANLMDHRAIRVDAEHFSAAYARKQHLVAREWLRQRLARPFEGKTVVITHHAPHERSVHRRYAGSPVNGCFVSRLESMMPGVDLWLHGHVHNGFDYQVGNCRVVANPRGYGQSRDIARIEDVSWENPYFEDQLVLEV